MLSKFTFAEALAILALFVSILALLGGIITVWVKLNVKVSTINKEVQDLRLETTIKIEAIVTERELKLEAIKKEMSLELKGIEEANKVRIEAIRAGIELRVAAIKSASKGVTDFFGQRIKEFVDDNKGDHNEIKRSIEKLFDVTGRIDKALGKLEK